MENFLAVGRIWPSLLAQAAAPAGGGSWLETLFANPLIPLMLTMMFLYFLLLRPDRQKRKQIEQLLAGLKKNDHVVTVGGICGTVVAATPDSKVVTIRVDDSTGTKLRVLRSAISHVGPTEEAEAEGKAGE